MTDFPPGEWSPLIIGDQWPDYGDILALEHGRNNRGAIKTGFTNFSDTLQDAQRGPLVEQRGLTADSLRIVFGRGEDHARRVAEKNNVKKNAYGAALGNVTSLRHDLANLAEESNREIRVVQDSKEDLATKLTRIVALIHQYRTLANFAAAKYAGNILDAMQRVLDEEGTGESARQFAITHGADVSRMFRQPNDQKDLETHVREILSNSGSPIIPSEAYRNPPLPRQSPPHDATDSLGAIADASRVPPPNQAPTDAPPPAQPRYSLASIARVGTNPTPLRLPGRRSHRELNLSLVPRQPSVQPHRLLG